MIFVSVYFPGLGRKIAIKNFDNIFEKWLSVNKLKSERKLILVIVHDCFGFRPESFMNLQNINSSGYYICYDTVPPQRRKLWLWCWLWLRGLIWSLENWTNKHMKNVVNAFRNEDFRSLVCKLPFHLVFCLFLGVCSTLYLCRNSLHFNYLWALWVWPLLYEKLTIRLDII